MTMTPAERRAIPKNRERAKIKARVWYAEHRERAIAWAAEWRKNNPEKYSAIQVRNVTKKHGLTFSGFYEMLRKQGGVCAICGLTNGNKRLAIDHDHSSGKVRALLCTKCNTGLGAFRDDVNLLMKAVGYLGEYGPKLAEVA
jgi:hypothetical protein